MEDRVYCLRRKFEGFTRGSRSMDMPAARVESKSHPSRDVIDAIVSERARFQRFLTGRTGSEAEAEDLLQQSLLKALQNDAQLRRGEKAIRFTSTARNFSLSDTRCEDASLRLPTPYGSTP